MFTNKKISNISKLLLTVFLFASSLTFAHFGSKGPYGGSVSCATVYDTTVYVGTVNGGVFSSTKSALVGWKAIPVGFKSGKITALTHSGSYLFAATADSGVYIFTGYVGTDRYWKKINNGLTNLQITSLVSIDSITIMAGTTGGGIFKTTNKGVSWIAINNFDLQHYDITGLAKAGNRIIHTSDGGVWASDDNGASWIDFNDVSTNIINTYKISYNATTDEILIANADGLYISANSSSTLTPVYYAAKTGLPANTTIHSISNNGTNWYIATNNGVFVSTTGTINWTSINSGLTTLDVNAVVPFQTRLVAGTNKEGIFKTFAGTINWIANNTTYNNQETYSMATSGALMVVAATEKGVFVSSDLAATYKRANNGLTDSLHVNDIIFAGAYLLAGTQNAGTFMSADSGKTWIAFNNGLPDKNIKKVFYLNSKTYAISSLGNVYRGDLAINAWTIIQTGLPSGVNPTSLTIYGTELILGTYGHGVYTKNETSGNWEAINTGLGNQNVTSVTTNGSKIFAGTDGLGVFVSDFPTTNWSQTSQTSIPHTTIMGLNGNKIQAMAYNAGYVFASYKGGLLASSDNGLTWIAGGNQFNLPSYSDINKISFVTSRVFVTSENNGLYSNALSELPSITTGINETTNNINDVVIYPNPVTTNFNIEMNNKNEKVSLINIYNITGKLIVSINNTEDKLLNNIPINVASGIYFIHLTIGEKVITRKIIKE